MYTMTENFRLSYCKMQMRDFMSSVEVAAMEMTIYRGMGVCIFVILLIVGNETLGFFLITLAQSQSVNYLIAFRWTSRTKEIQR